MYKIKKLIILLVILISGSLKAQVLYIAHRGASHLAPENTLASVKLAWEIGADASEIDVHLSKDNRVMVIHDYNTKRVSGVYYKIIDTNSKELRRLDVGSFKNNKYKKAKIPFLEEVIAAIPKGKKLVIELKSKENTIPYIKEIVSKSGKQNQLLFICFDWNTIVTLKKEFPTNKCYWLSGNRADILNKVKEVAKFNLDGIDVNHFKINKKMIELYQKEHLSVVAYTVDNPREATRLVELGVIGITTNRPSWLNKKLKD